MKKLLLVGLSIFLSSTVFAECYVSIISSNDMVTSRSVEPVAETVLSNYIEPVLRIPPAGVPCGACMYTVIVENKSISVSGPKFSGYRTSATNITSLREVNDVLVDLTKNRVSSAKDAPQTTVVDTVPLDRQISFRGGVSDLTYDLQFLNHPEIGSLGFKGPTTSIVFQSTRNLSYVVSASENKLNYMQVDSSTEYSAESDRYENEFAELVRKQKATGSVTYGTALVDVGLWTGRLGKASLQVGAQMIKGNVDVEGELRNFALTTPAFGVDLEGFVNENVSVSIGISGTTILKDNRITLNISL